MKKLSTLIAAVLICIQLFAQAPQKMSYQAVIRNASNNLVTNAPVKMRISILQGSATGTSVYSELHSATTNANGLVSIEIGGGTSQQGTFSGINWGNGTYFLKTETDPNNGTNYSIVGISQLLSVPYSIYANTASNIDLGNASQGQVLTYCNGKATWTTGGICPPPAPNITSLNCAGATNNGTLTAVTAASGVNSVVSYSGGNGGIYIAQAINSTGVTGLTATLASGTLANGAGSLTYTITGTPTTSGTASFTLSIGEQTCTLTRIVGSPVIISNPVVTTTAVTSITTTTAISGGNVTSDGNAAVTVRGVVWGTSPNPTIALVTKTSNGTGTGIFNSNISGLTVGTLYYVRAYATNSVGTAYGNEVSFTTLESIFNPNLTYGSVSDIDGNSYKTIQIGTQTWMAENLRTTKYKDGSNIPVVTDNTQWGNNWNNGNPLQQPMMCWYNNDQATYSANKFGALYNWYAINPATNGNKNVCPTGWHVPTDAEWIVLTEFLGSESAAVAKMKSTGTQYWQGPNNDATNISGFSGLPAGARPTNGVFGYISYYGFWWSSTEFTAQEARIRYLYYSPGYALSSYWNKNFGISVRCIKD